MPVEGHGNKNMEIKRLQNLIDTGNFFLRGVALLPFGCDTLRLAYELTYHRQDKKGQQETVNIWAGQIVVNHDHKPLPGVQYGPNEFFKVKGKSICSSGEEVDMPPHEFFEQNFVGDDVHPDDHAYIWRHSHSKKATRVPSLKGGTIECVKEKRK